MSSVVSHVMSFAIQMRGCGCMHTPLPFHFVKDVLLTPWGSAVVGALCAVLMVPICTLLLLKKLLDLLLCRAQVRHASVSTNWPRLTH